METITSFVEPVTTADIFDLASWDRSRSREEIRSFLDSREAACDVEDFDL